MIAVQTPSGPKTVAALSILTPSGAKNIARGSILTPTGAKDFFVSGSGGGLTVEASPISATGVGSASGTTDVVTNAVTVTVTGGTAPYTYAWDQESGDAVWSITAPTAMTTRFIATVDADSTESGSFSCTVTDARGRTGTVTVTANAYNYSGLVGF